MPENSSESAEDRLARCLAVVAKNVPVTEDLLRQLADCQLLGEDSQAGRKSAKGNNRRAPTDYHQLFVSMATLGKDRLCLLAACLRVAGHQLMAEFLLQTVTDSGTDAGSQQLPESVQSRLSDSPHAESELRQLLTEAQLTLWCQRLFDPAGADVMSLRRQHAEESWRAAKEVREKTAALAQLQDRLTAVESALTDRDQMIDQLESHQAELSAKLERSQQQLRQAIPGSTGDNSHDDASKIESYRAAMEAACETIRQFESDGSGHLPLARNHSESQEVVTSNALKAFTVDFEERLMPLCQTMLEERRQLTRLAKNLSAKHTRGTLVRGEEFDPNQPLARELARLVAEITDENANLTARHRLLRQVLDESASSNGDGQLGVDPTSDELVAAVGLLRRQIADRDRRLAALTRPIAEGEEADYAAENSLAAIPHQPRSATVARAWDEIAPTGEGAQPIDPRRRFSVLPDIRQRPPAAPAQIPHGHRKATKRESNLKRKEPPGKPLSANVVSLS